MVVTKKIFGSVCCLALFAALFFSCSLKPAVPVSVTIPAAPVDPALVKGTLDNGFRYLIMKNTTPKERVSVHLNVFTGSLNETEKERGLAHFLEHMVFNGSEHFKPGELVTYFQSLGMDFGADANARTSFFTTIYDLALPKGSEEYLTDAFTVIGDYAGGALLLPEEIDRERGVILAEKRERDSVDYRTYQRELGFEFPDSLLPERMPIGTHEVIQYVDQKTMKAFYDRWYRPDNMVLVIVGDVDIALAQSLIEKKFKSLVPRSPDLTTVMPGISWTPHKGIRFFYHREPEAGATRVAIERVNHKKFISQTTDGLKGQALEDLANQIFQNRLSRMVRKRQADFTSAYVYSGVFLRHVDVASIQASCDPEHWASVLGRLDISLRQALKYGFSNRELERAKADMVSALNAGVETASTRKSQGIARRLLSGLNNQTLFLSPEQEKQLLVPFVQGLCVADVNRAFRNLWPEDHRLVMVSGNLDAGKDPEKKIEEIYTSSRAVVPVPWTEPGYKSFPYLSLPQESQPPLKTIDNAKGLGIRQIDLKNNVRINLKSTAFKKGEFKFKAVFGKGLADMPSKLFGFNTLIESAVDESGFGAMDPVELEAALAGRDISFRFNIDETSFSIEGRAAPSEAELVMQVLYTYFKDPGFRQNSLDLAKETYRQQYNALGRTPEGVMEIRANRFLAGDDPRFGLKSPDAAGTVSIAKIRDWIQPAFDKGALDVSFVGDFNPDTTGRLAARYLGALPSRKAAQAYHMPGHLVFPKGQTRTYDLDTRLNKAVIRVAFLTDDFWQINQTRKLSLLSQVLSERLRNVIRETLGASYAPYVYNHASLGMKGYGVMNAVVNLSADQVDALGGKVMEVFEQMGQITPEELDLVKAPLINRLKVIRQTNAYWLDSVMAGSSRHPERLDWASSLMSGYSNITAAQLNRVAQTYIVPEERALIKVLPETRKKGN